MDFGARCQHYGTDKGKYHLAYTRWLEPQTSVLKILEMGIGGGGSTRVWLDYLPNAQIIAIDNKPSALRDIVNLHSLSRVTVYIGSQADPTFLVYLIRKYGLFDVIVDDAGHVPEEQKIAFDMLYPCLNGTGMYIIEDIPIPLSNHWVVDIPNIDVERSLNTEEVIVRIRR